MIPNQEQIKALELTRGVVPTPNAIANLSKHLGSEHIRWAFTIWSLRDRARAKFVKANEMLFVTEALEQATHEAVASYHASQFPKDVLVCDLTAGIGSDLIALARRGPAIGYEINQERSEFAKHNLAVNDLEASVIVQSCLDATWDFEYAFSDPGRRLGGRRLKDPSDFMPDPDELSSRMKSLMLGGIKLSPLIDDRYLESLGPRLEFVSFERECREAIVWTGALAEAGRFAVLLGTGGVHRIKVSDSQWAESVDSADGYLYEADPAAIRAHALPDLGGELGMKLLGDSNGYLTSNEVAESIWLRRYSVIDQCPFDEKTVRSLLRKLGGGRPILKVRGAKIDVGSWSKRLTLPGDGQPIIAIYPIGKSLRAIILSQ